MKLKPFASYKDSGVPWLGSMPKHWNSLPNRALFTERIVRGFSDETLLSVTIRSGVIPQEKLLSNSSKKDSSNEDKSNYKLTEPGDIAYNKMRAWQGAIGVADHRGIVSPAYIVVRLYNNNNQPKYFHYLMRTPNFAKEAERWSYGITSDQWSLRFKSFKPIYVPVPPPAEQTAIAQFLGYIDRRITRFIVTKRKLIDLLSRQKTALIQHAVTRGLDSEAPLKFSQIEWLGEAPAHWEEKRAKYYFRELDKRSKTGEEELLSVSHITGITPRSQKNITMFKAASYVGHKLCEPGDLVINTMWAWMGALGIAKQSGIVSSSYAVYRPIEENIFVPAYVDILLRTQPYVSEYICRSTGIRSSRLRLYPDKFLSIPILRPPFDEQLQIVEFVTKQTRRLVKAIDHAKREIELVQEYRERLISDVVTGKLDVREAASMMPLEEEDELQSSSTVADSLGSVDFEEVIPNDAD